MFSRITSRFAGETGVPRLRDFGFLGFAVALLVATGCAVPQPRGAGQLERMVEPTTNRGYWRYLSAPYVKATAEQRRDRRWPVVVTFHGMKPFDNAHPQALEWEQEADRYGFIVVAPELRAPDVLAEFPVRNVHPAFKSDEDSVLAVLDHIFATTQADPANVLSTSWSSGGYMAHYMLNRHPERFTCLAVRQSNFSSSILDSGMTGRSSSSPILILNTENDFAVCVAESREAREWYKKFGYRNLAWVEIRSLGHERTPDLAADFFARVAGVEPLVPPTVLATRQAINGNEEGIAFLSGKMAFNRSGSSSAAAAPTLALASSPDATRIAGPNTSGNSQPASPVQTKPTPTRKQTAPQPNPAAMTNSNPQQPAPAMSVRSVPQNQGQPDYSGVRQAPPSEPRVTVKTSLGPPPGQAKNSTNKPVREPVPQDQQLVQAQPTQRRANAVPSQAIPRRDPLAIRVSSAIGIEPLHLNFSAECPPEWYNNSSFAWTIGGEAAGSGVNGQKTIAKPGEYVLSLLVTRPDGVEHRSSRTIRVIPRLNASTAANSGGR